MSSAYIRSPAPVHFPHSCPRARLPGITLALSLSRDIFKLPPGHELRRVLERGGQFERPHLRLQPRQARADGVRRRRQVPALARRRHVQQPARPAHRCRRQHLGDRQRLAHRREDGSATGAFSWCSASKARTEEWHQYGHLRCFDEPNDIAFGRGGRDLRHAGPRQRRVARAQVRRRRQFPEDLGRRGHGARPVQRPALDRDRRRGARSTSPTGRTRESRCSTPRERTSGNRGIPARPAACA